MTSDLHAAGCTCCADLLRLRYDRRRFLTLSAAAGVAAALPSFALAAEGNYEAMLLTCIDPRFPEPTIKYMQKRNMSGKYSQFTFAGASIGVVAPAFKTWGPAFWENLAASMQLHHIPKVIAMNHRDCGAAKIAYGPEAVKDKATETATHQAALTEFKKQVSERQPTLQVELGLMAVDGSVEMFS
jgi:carbonic anhydrase